MVPKPKNLQYAHFFNERIHKSQVKGSSLPTHPHTEGQLHVLAAIVQDLRIVGADLEKKSAPVSAEGMLGMPSILAVRGKEPAWHDGAAHGRNLLLVAHKVARDVSWHNGEGQPPVEGALNWRPGH